MEQIIEVFKEVKTFHELLLTLLEFNDDKIAFVCSHRVRYLEIGNPRFSDRCR